MRYLAFLLLLAVGPVAAQSIATYRVTFESTWSAATHPDGFPANPHFSGLVGATHEPGVGLWGDGETASPGIESMAETGNKALLEGEVAALVAGGQAEMLLSGGGIGVSPGSVVLDVTVSASFPLVSLVSMIAPSPDWFVGVDGLDLRDGAGWVSEVDVPLYAYDAGTDSGTSYTAANADTQPREPIAPITGAPFLIGGSVQPVGTFTFTLQTATGMEPEAPDVFALESPAPNPVASTATIRLRLGTSQPLRAALFDALGRRVAVLHDGPLSAGTPVLTVDASALPNGLYLVQIRSEEQRTTRRLVVQH